MIDFEFPNVSAYFVNIIIKIPTLIRIKGDIYPISFKSTLFLNILSIIFQFASENNQNAPIYTENQMQHNKYFGK